MKKLTNLLIYILIFNILIFLTLLLDIYSNKNDITQTSIEISIASNDNYNLIEQILKDTNKKDLIKFIDYIELDIDQSIKNDIHNYTAFTIRLPQNNSFIALYKKNHDNTYNFSGLVDNLYSVDNFYFHNEFFIVEESINNSTNSNNNKKTITIFLNYGNTYMAVLSKDTYTEKINDKNKNIISSSITFLDGDITKVLYVSTYKTLPLSSDKLNNSMEYSEYNKHIIKETYEWDINLNEFKLINKEIIKNK